MAAESSLKPSDLAWTKRIIIISENINDGVLRKQYEMFDNDINAFQERDVVILSLSDKGLSSKFPPDLLTSDADDWNNWALSYFDADSDAKLLLIGKDTGLKKSWVEADMPVKPQVIFDIIDSMPMRMQEMKNQK